MLLGMSGSVNVPGGEQTPNEGGTLLQNSCPDIESLHPRWRVASLNPLSL